MRKPLLIVAGLLLLLCGIVWTMSQQQPAPQKTAPAPKSPASPAVAKTDPSPPAPAPIPADQGPPTPSRNPFRLPSNLVKIFRDEYKRQQDEILKQQQQQNAAPGTPAPEVKPEQLFDVQGVFWGTPQPQAIINRRVVSVGDEIKGAKVISIGKDGVTLMFNGKEVLMKPPAPERFRNRDSSMRETAPTGYR